VVGIGIANVWTRHPAVMQGAAATLGSAWPGRFILGVGIGHAATVNASAMAYERPLDHMSRYLTDMDAAADEGPVTEVAVPRMAAGLRPGMLAVARDQSDGACTYFVPPPHTPMARAVLGPDRLLIPEQAVVLSDDPAEARRIAQEHMDFYLRFPNFAGNLRALGYTEDDLSAGGSDRLVDALVAWGDEAAIARRIREHLDAGADHVLLQPLGDIGTAVGQLERLAPAVLQG
jgi:probable F420-dependent oxidoreductase